MNQVNESIEDQLSFKEIFDFLKIKTVKIIIRSIISFVVVIGILGVLYAFIPYHSSYYRDMIILLDKKNQISIYPSGKAFSAYDVISPLVLKNLYTTHKFQDRIKFDEFCSMFSVVGQNQEREKLDAEYRQKMSQKNLTVVDLQALEREYYRKQSAISTDSFRLVAVPSIVFSNSEILEILNKIPETWFNIYSKLEAGDFPQIETSKKLEKIIKSSRQSQLMTLEKTRSYCQELIVICQKLNEMLQGKNINLPTGECLGDVQKELEDIVKYQIALLQQYMLSHPQNYSSLDEMFIESCLQYLERDLLRVNRNYESIIDSLNIIQAKNPRVANVAKQNNADNQPNAMSLEIKESFFDQFADMIRNEANNILRQEYVRKATKYGERRAKLEAEQKYFEQMKASINKTKSMKAAAKFNASGMDLMLKNMYSDILEVSQKVKTFRDLITTDYLDSRSFYAPIGDIRYQKDFRFSIVKIAVGLLALWLIFNVVAVIIDFSQFNNLSNNQESAPQK